MWAHKCFILCVLEWLVANSVYVKKKMNMWKKIPFLMLRMTIAL